VVHGDGPRVAAAALLMHQAFLNIIINAEHAIVGAGVAGGRIEVRSWHDERHGQVVTTIGDTGPGIPAEALSRVFDPFFTTKDVGRGTGLGLAITYGIVQEHGGTIAATNQPGGGALVTISLPAAS
jgi:signal transduction histidine kinase